MILYATSFNEKMYEATGKQLLESFVRTNTEGRFFISYEGFFPDMPLTRHITRYGLDSNVWISRIDSAMERREKSGYWNKNVCGWFRKPLTLYRALSFWILDSPIIVWVDSDCVFLRKIEESYIESLFSDSSAFYFQAKREYPETGCIGFDTRRMGGDLILEFFLRYATFSFLDCQRWDDCCQFLEALKSNEQISAVDLATHGSGSANVLNNSPLCGYLQHRKGTHKRIKAYS